MVHLDNADVSTQVEACKSGQLYVVNVVSRQGAVLSELTFNAQTGCLGANTVQVRVQMRPTAHAGSCLCLKRMHGLPPAPSQELPFLAVPFPDATGPASISGPVEF